MMTQQHNVDVAEIAEIWPLTSVTIGTRLAASSPRKAFVLYADEGTFVLKIDPSSRGNERETLSVLDYLEKRRYRHAPGLIRTRSGARSEVVRAGTACVLEYIPLEVTDGVGRPKTWWELGGAVAKLNQETHYAQPYGIPIDAALDEIAEQATGQPFERELYGLLDRVAQLTEAHGFGLIHGEVNEANARRRADGTVVLVDWDQAGQAASILDVGYPLITTFLSTGNLELDDTTARAYYAGYVNGGGQIDEGQLFNAALFHALRYMWFADTALRWERIAYAVSHESELLAVLSQ